MILTDSISTSCFNDQVGNTLLHAACSPKYHEVYILHSQNESNWLTQIHYLFEIGVDFCAINKVDLVVTSPQFLVLIQDGHSALHYAQSHKIKGCEIIEKYMVIILFLIPSSHCLTELYQRS